MKNKIKKILSIILIVILVSTCMFLIIQYIRALTKEIKNPILTLEIENYGNVKIELYPEYAPNTVKNIIKLVENGYYDGKVLYGADEISVYVGRNSEGEIDYPKLSTLDKEVVSEDDYEYEIKGEFVANGFEANTLRHEKGIVSMIRADYTQMLGNSLIEQSYNSGSSQFTILTSDARNLNGMYAAFGKVIEGMDAIEKIYSLEKAVVENEEETEVSSIEKFVTMPVITKATVDTFGTNYGYPEVNEAFDYDGYLQQVLSQYYSTEQ